MSSLCNLKCLWCIGNEIQSEKQVVNLANALDDTNIISVVDGILATKNGSLGVDTIKFSGFIGDPLVEKVKKATLIAIERLWLKNLSVGLFTNGINMDKDTWSILSKIDYVHISLDSGPYFFYWLKENKKKNPLYSQDTFNKILENIKGFHDYRSTNNGSAKLNIGYVVVAGNEFEIYETTKRVKEAGADMIRFKCDITGKHSWPKTEWHENVFKEIARAKTDFHEPNKFTVHSIHSQQEVEASAYSNWNCKEGCYYQDFVSTIGSDGNVYLCDHNTMPGALSLGNAIIKPFDKIWLSEDRKVLARSVAATCQSSVCPPFGNRINAFLKEIVELKKEYGSKAVICALNELRKTP